MINMDHTYYTDAFLDACLLDYASIELTARPFATIKDEDMEEAPIPLARKQGFTIDFGLSPQAAPL